MESFIDMNQSTPLTGWILIITGALAAAYVAWAVPHGYHLLQKYSSSKRPMLSRMGQHIERSLTPEGVLVTSQFEFKNVGRAIADKIKVKAKVRQGIRESEKTLGDDMIITASPEEKLKFEISKFLIPLEEDKLKELMNMVNKGEKVNISREVSLSSPISLELSLEYIDDKGRAYSHKSNYKYDVTLNQWILEE